MFDCGHKMFQPGISSLLVSLTIAAILLSVACKPTLDEAKRIERLYEDVCYEEQGVKLTSIEEIRALLREQKRLNLLPAEDNYLKCPGTTQEAIETLNDLISLDEENICTQRKANFMRNFHLDFIINKGRQLPMAIKKFFATYGNRVSQACRNSMIMRLSNIQPKLSELDNSIMDEWSSESSPLSYILKDPSDYEDLVLPETLAELLKVRRNKMVLKLNTGYQIKRYQHICERRFNPIYGPIIMPLITLKTIGFNFKNLNAEPRDVRLNQLIYRWYRVAFMCEAFNAFDIRVNGETEPDSKPVEMTIVRHRSDRKSNLSETSNDDDTLLKESIKDIQYSKDLDLRREVVKVRLPDPLVEGEDESMNAALEAYFDRTKTGFRYLLGWLKELAQRLKGGLEQLTRKNLQISDANKLIKLIDEQQSKMVPNEGSKNTAIEEFKQETLARKISEIWASFKGNIGKNAVTVMLTAIVLNIFSGVGYVVSRDIECDRAAESAMAALDGDMNPANSLKGQVVPGPCDGMNSAYGLRAQIAAAVYR